MFNKLISAGVVSVRKIRSSILVMLTHQLALPLLRLIRKPEIFPYPAEGLKQFPEQSLGKDLFLFLEKRNLPLLPYYARHDIKHILLDYDTTDDGEVCLQCFMMGNGHFSFPVAATVLYGYITMPEHWKKFRIAYQRGKNAVPISDWVWFDILHEPTQSLKQKINSTYQIHPDEK